MLILRGVKCLGIFLMNRKQSKGKKSHISLESERTFIGLML